MIIFKEDGDSSFFFDLNKLSKKQLKHKCVDLIRELRILEDIIERKNISIEDKDSDISTYLGDIEKSIKEIKDLKLQLSAMQSAEKDRLETRKFLEKETFEARVVNIISTLRASMHDKYKDSVSILIEGDSAEHHSYGCNIFLTILIDTVSTTKSNVFNTKSETRGQDLRRLKIKSTYPDEQIKEKILSTVNFMFNAIDLELKGVMNEEKEFSHLYTQKKVNHNV